MDLLEYQGKQLFRKHGVPTPEGRPATTVEEAGAVRGALRYETHPGAPPAPRGLGGGAPKWGVRAMKASYATMADDARRFQASLLRLRDRMRVDKDVVFAGMGKIIEIWSKQLWEEELEESAKEAPQILDEVRELIRI